MKAFIWIIKLTLIISMFYGCAEQPEPDCSSADNCSEEPEAPVIRSTKMTVDFDDSHFYDLVRDEWRTLRGVDIENGQTGGVIPIYSDFVNLNKTEAIEKVKIAQIQKENSSSYSKNEYNLIPYIRVVATDESSVIYKYKKIDPSGIEVGGATGEFYKDGESFYLPLVNSYLNDVFFPKEATGSQLGFTHKIQIVAQSASTQASDVTEITFNAKLIVPSKYFDINYSDAFKSFDIHDRWQYFYKNVDRSPNTDLDLASIVEKTGETESIALDLKVVFKQKPVIKIDYTVFDENNLVIKDYGYNSQISVVRGYEFYEKSYSLTSERDFFLNFKINKEMVTIDEDSREAIYRNMNPDTPWELTFGYDLSQNPKYVAGKTLLKPLMPICNTLTNTMFSPLSEKKFMDAIFAAEGVAIQCHPDTLKKETVAKDEINTTTIDLVDTWYDSFSYMASKTGENTDSYQIQTPGHLYGVKTINFNIEGCFKLYTREASVQDVNPNAWEQKNEEDAECTSGEGDEGWTKFNISREFSIFDNIEQYDDKPGLKELLNTYRNAVIKNQNTMHFNGDEFIEHIH